MVLSDSLRSFGVLGLAFASVVVAVLALSGVLVSTPEGTVRGPDGRPIPATSSTPAPAVAGIPGLGGTLSVTGDREGTLTLSSAHEGARYALAGADGRVSFEGVPVEVAQVSYDGLEFFPDPGDCTLGTGNLEGVIGLGFADLECHGLDDVRGNGTIDLAGELGLPVDLLRERSLPPSGGSIAVGDETWVVAEAELSTWQLPARGGMDELYNLVLHDPEHGTLNIRYDVETRRLVPRSIVRQGTQVGLDEDACTFEREELGQHNPRTIVIELTVACPAIDVPGLGTVAVQGTLVVDEYQWPI